MECKQGKFIAVSKERNPLAFLIGFSNRGKIQRIAYLMIEDWSLVYQVRWFIWIPMSLYAEIVELFMAVLGLGGVGTGLAYLFGMISLPTNESMPTWLFFIELLLAAWLAWSGLRGSWGAILALFTPGMVYEGPLDKITTRHFSSPQGGYRGWVLTAGDKSWEIGKVQNETLDTKIEGKQVRIQYRRGTNEITHLWTKSNEHKHHH